MTQKGELNRTRRWWIVLPIVGVLLIVAIVLTPQNISKLSSQPNPVQSYEEAVQRIEDLRAQEPSEMLAVCRLQLLTHEKKVDRAIILVHGYTNCPQQFYALGEQFYDAGYNVLMVPSPHHGLTDRMTEEHARLKAEELAAYADETVDIAQGLGEEVVMMGISAGGVTTSWAAQNRSDLDLAVIISPAFGFKQIPTPLTAAVMNIYTFLPDEFVWWDPVLEGEAPPPHAYPRYSKHALVQTLRLGFATQAAAQRAQPAAGKIIVVLNPNDSSVNNELTMAVADIWQAHGANLSTYEFEAELDLGHDLIDPTQPDQKIDIVYPRLIELASQ